MDQKATKRNMDCAPIFAWPVHVGYSSW